MKCVSPKVWLVGLPCVCAFALHRSHSTGAAAVSSSKCMDDPESCASGVKQMAETARTITQEVHHELNATRRRFDKILKEFEGCNSLMSQVNSYRSSFATKVRSHTQCRQQQKADNDVTMMCKKVLSAAETNRTLLCERESLTRATNDLVPLCKPAVKQSLGMWLEDMAELFNIRYMEWKKDYAACQNAEVALRTQAAECSVAEGTLAQQTQLCGGDLDSLESFLCSWATGFGARCSSYESCLASALTRHSDAVREAEASVVRWRKSWLAAARMECMAKAIDGSGAVDQAKMHACNGKNITDMSFLNFTIEKPPSKAGCPTPEIYPGSTLYREEVYGKLPAGLSVRQPTPCLLSLCSTVDLKKLHRDVPIRGTTDITTYNNTLYMSGVRAFDMWTDGRNGAPVYWLDAPKDETYTFEVDCRLVKGGEKLIAFVSVYDGPDGANNFPFTFGPRTWGGNGVGIENIGSVYSKDANPGLGEDPFVWHRLRVVRRPGVVFDTAYRRLDGSDWVQVSSGMTPSHIQSEGTRIALGLKQGGSYGVIEFRNLVVYGGEPRNCMS